MRPLARRLRGQGFSLLELLAVIATIATLAALLLPILGKAKIKAIQTGCMSNLHQLGLAWSMYSNDNNSLLAESYPVNNPNAWIQGDMKNPVEAVNPELIRKGKLYPYNMQVSLYHCPADKGVPIEDKRLPSVRSYSMNSFMGARDSSLGPIPPTAKEFVLFYSKESDIREPARRWVLLDEDERSINDGFFVTDPTARMWVDFPASSAHRHKYSYSLVFADGHSEAWRHHDSRTMHLSKSKVEQPGNTDLARLATATAHKKSGEQ